LFLCKFNKKYKYQLLLMVDELPQATYARYVSGINNVASNYSLTLDAPIYTNTTYGYSFLTLGAPIYANTTHDNVTDNINMATQVNPIEEEENCLNNYLIWVSSVKEEVYLEKCRHRVKNSISELKIGE